MTGKHRAALNQGMKRGFADVQFKQNQVNHTSKTSPNSINHCRCGHGMDGAALLRQEGAHLGLAFCFQK